MTIKKAAEIFKVDEKVIRKSIKDGMLKKYTNGRKIEISDDTKFIPVKNEIKRFLFQILCYKNNSHYPVSRNMCPDTETLKILFDYLYNMGYIAECEFSDNISTLFENITLTDEATNFIFSKYKVEQIKAAEFIPIQINPTIRVGLNIG